MAVDVMQHGRRIVGDTRIGVHHGANHRHHNGGRCAVAGDVGHQDAEAVAAQREHVVVIAAGMAAGLVERREADRRMHRHRRRQDQALHAGGAGELMIETIAALPQGLLEVLS